MLQMKRRDVPKNMSKEAKLRGIYSNDRVYQQLCPLTTYQKKLVFDPQGQLHWVFHFLHLLVSPSEQCYPNRSMILYSLTDVLQWYSGYQESGQHMVQMFCTLQLENKMVFLFTDLVGWTLKQTSIYLVFHIFN